MTEFVRCPFCSHILPPGSVIGTGDQAPTKERLRRRGGWSPLDRLDALHDMSQALDEDGVAIGLPIRAVMQEHEHSPEMPGDCLRACVAAILGLERDDVPHFARYGLDDPEPDHGGWWFALVGFCDLLDPSYRVQEVEPDDLPAPSSSRADLFGMYLAGGKSPRGGVSHVVVARGGQTIWDPHPSRAGIDGEPTYAFVLTQRESAPPRDDERDGAKARHSGSYQEDDL